MILFYERIIHTRYVYMIGYAPRHRSYPHVIPAPMSCLEQPPDPSGRTPTPPARCPRSPWSTRSSRRQRVGSSPRCTWTPPSRTFHRQALCCSWCFPHPEERRCRRQRQRTRMLLSPASMAARHSSPHPRPSWCYAANYHAVVDLQQCTCIDGRWGYSSTSIVLREPREQDLIKRAYMAAWDCELAGCGG